jgi:uncharacterized protein (DUF952 family)
MLIYKIIPRIEWEKVAEAYHGSAHDRADGFLHFSTHAQLPETLRKHYAGQRDLMLVAVEAAALGEALKWEYAHKRQEDFPHLYTPLPKSAVIWAIPLQQAADGEFLLPPEK